MKEVIHAVDDVLSCTICGNDTTRIEDGAAVCENCDLIRLIDAAEDLEEP